MEPFEKRELTTEEAELQAEDAFLRRYQKALLCHPDCRDPDHPGCEKCMEEEE